MVVASSGVASLLLPGGRTTHSRFNIPINIEEYSTCRISKQTQLARLIEETALIIWDEAPMIHRNCLEALNKTLQDLLADKKLEASITPFGGKTILFGGDFRQILPVIKYGNKTDIINATITQSHIWQKCKVFRFETNIRLHKDNLDEQNRNQLREFGNWLLQISDVIITSTERNDNDDEKGDWIEIPENLLIKPCSDLIDSIIQSVYPQFTYSQST